MRPSLLAGGLALLGLLLVGRTARAEASDYHTDPLCWGKDDDRLVEPDAGQAASILKGADEQLTIARVHEELRAPFVRNPGGYYAYSTQSALLANLWSGATKVDITVFVERPYLLRLRFAEVFNLEKVSWISEKLLYIRVALGRFASVDYVYDVESEKIVLKQALYDATNARRQGLESCQVPGLAKLPMCHPSCYRLRPD